MKHFPALLALSFLLSTHLFAEVARLPDPQRKVLQDTGRFHPLSTVAQLPKALVTLCGDDKGRMADPGQEWETTDVVTHKALSSKRMIWAVTDGEWYVLHYESGGIGHAFHVVIIQMKPPATRPAFQWHAFFFDPAPTLASFLKALDAGRLQDLPGASF